METQEFWKLTDKELKKLFNPPFDRRRLVDVSPRWRAVLFAECDWSRSARKIVGTGRGYLAGIDDNGQRWGWIVNNLVQPLDPRGYSVPSGSIETAIKLAYDLPYWVPLEGAIRQGDLLFVPGEPEPPFWACRSCYRQVPEDRRHEDCPGCGKPGSIVLCGVVRFSPVASGAAILRGSHRIASEDLELDSNYYWVRSPNPITVTHPSHQEVVLPPGTYRIYRSLVNDGD